MGSLIGTVQKLWRIFHTRLVVSKAENDTSDYTRYGTKKGENGVTMTLYRSPMKRDIEKITPS